ncbi:MAG: DUF2852 domain-containing protein [Methylobacteriaceae bacterium]|nr:DUF2852 domain-containing protein [Methylobacteriaceae bacterium]
MSAYTNTIDTGPWNNNQGYRRCSRWHPLELAAMIGGFIVFWPVGLAILFLKIAQKKEGYPGDLFAYARDKASAKWQGWNGAQTWSGGWQSRGFGMRATGNSAFDDWRNAELARLEEERRKLVQAEREFSEHLDRLRRARDREEFDRFMNERRNAQSGPHTDGPPPSA